MRGTNTAAHPAFQDHAEALCAECCVLQEATGSAADFFGLLIINIQVSSFPQSRDEAISSEDCMVSALSSQTLQQPS